MGGFVKENDIDGIRSVALALLYVDFDIIEGTPFSTHPFFESCLYVCTDEKAKKLGVNTLSMGKNTGYVLNLEKPEHLEIARKELKKRIEKLDVLKIYTLIRKQYKLCFLKYAKPYLTRKDFSEYLADAWVLSENPNQDINVDLKTLYGWYKQASKTHLMTKEEYEVYKNLPDEIKIYRGVGKNRNPEGMSWTMNYDKAKWFAQRWGNEGYIREGCVKKNNVLAYFNTRGEDELVCYIDDVFDITDSDIFED